MFDEAASLLKRYGGSLLYVSLQQPPGFLVELGLGAGRFLWGEPLLREALCRSSNGSQAAHPKGLGSLGFGHSFFNTPTILMRRSSA
jgi:hypothetical protein